MGIKMIHHICIQTEKYKESLDFYTRILGFEVVQESKNFHNREYNTWIKQGTFMIELQTPKAGDKFKKWTSLNEGPVHMGFIVDNVEEEYKRIKSLGYTNFKVKNGEIVYKVEGESLFKIKAPEGTEIEIRDTDIA
ncbi:MULTISPECIES: VOC family protein [Romboutsia]|nr:MULTISPECIES: VOC family protein [Romboutsia]MCH1958611.1 VOC family protein [Romboutsia hominis]MCH1970528.1 VOC family protein [Romboutsia hominis]MDB8789222.1 VOC family protein [Romboutsia sp. 1001216sp1]MDB8793224.1 VOC family protein [Romboutsia sp. 1001216sp1]MDB8796016.1 VOC family protein [Romboutsia sp. 1001216sp1]